MNSVKIEKSAIIALKRIINLHGQMDELLKDVDKEPSWDGDILIYSNEDLKAEDIIYRIPAQVKGKNDEKLLKRRRITYQVAYKNLRNYFNDGGVCYFVIAISDDGEKTSIFYNALTPIKLQSLLKGTEKKRPDQKKSIPLTKLKNDDKNELFRLLFQFGHDSREQGAKELIRKSILLEDIGKIDFIRATTFASEKENIFKEMTSGEICWFGHLADADIWLPFDYDTQMQMEIITCVKMDVPFKIDRTIYYDSFEIRKNVDKTFSIKLSENLSISIEKSKFDFRLMTGLEQTIKDIQFLEAVPYGKAFYAGERKICKYTNLQLGDRLQQMINELKQLQLATIKFSVGLNKDFADFIDKDWKAIDELLSIYQGKIKPKNKAAWHIWWWQGKVVPFFLIYASNGELCIENGTNFKHFSISVDSEGERHIVPSFITFKRDIWEKLYDVNEEVLLEELNKGEFNKNTAVDFTRLFIEILSAYDAIKSEKYYNMAKVISDKLLAVNSKANYIKINRLQLIKRKRSLSEDELQELEIIENNTDVKEVICAVNILLDNKRKAQKELDGMPDEDREAFMTYPIYNLL